MKIIGHRGAAGLEVENSIKSILKAIEIGVDYVEIDVRETKEGEIIVFHDSYLDRLTQDTGPIGELWFDELQSVKLTNGDRIPTLNEVIDAVKGKTKLLVEVKTEKALDRVVEILTEELPYSDFIIGSFLHKGIMDLKNQNPQIQTSIMFESVPVDLDEYLMEVNPDFVVTSIETNNQYLINTVKSQNRKLVFYTVNTEPDIKLANKLSPFAVITNFPNVF